MGSFGWMFCLALTTLAVITSASQAQGDEQPVCISQGSRFPKFALEGKPPQRSRRGPTDLNLCRIYRGKTCCTRAQTEQALVTIRNLAVYGAANERCLELWETLECSICDPRVGTSPGPPVLCHSLCKSLFDACTNAQFSIIPTRKFQGLLPCSETEYICPPGKDFAPNSTYFCQLAGFKVSSETESEFCYDGSVEEPEPEAQPTGVKVSEAETARSTDRKRKRRENLKVVTAKELLNQLREFLMANELVMVVFGLVSAVVLLFFRQRRARARRRMKVMKKILASKSGKKTQ